MSSYLLLKNGTILCHNNQDDIVVLKNTDILVQDDRIAEIGPNLSSNEKSSIIDCRDKIISPGFIDAHHHLWQTQLKGRFGDQNLLNYMIDANLQSINFTSTDMFWGQLGGCLEAMDAGTTCVVDNAHMGSGPEHGAAALSATIASGIRAIFCYGVSPLRAVEWTQNSFELDTSPLPDWLLKQMTDLSSRAPFGDDSRVQLGFFFDSYFLPQEIIVRTFEHIRKLGVRMITSHFRHWPISKGQANIPEKLDSCSMLGPDILLAHGNGVTLAQASLLSSSGVYIASTPDAEVFMASGADPIAFRPDLPLTCLGADCHSCGPSSMVHQMQMALSSDRGAQTSSAFADDRYPRQFRATLQQAFNLATIKAARAVRMEDKIGSIAVGKLADLVLFDTRTPTMTCAAQHDPLAAVVRHSGPRDVDTVIVGGRVRKQGGRMQDVSINEGLKTIPFQMEKADVLHEGMVTWNEVVEKLAISREAIQGRINGVNKDLARTKIMALMGGLENVLQE
ncbi:Fc.00g002220.m01.CDS01 [Cosmosporella sp. VM-42]